MLPIYLLERIHGLAHPAPLARSLRAGALLAKHHFHSSAYTLASAPPKPSKGKEKAHAHQSSVLLPKTGFPLRADAVKRERLFWDRTTDELYAWQVIRAGTGLSTREASMID